MLELLSLANERLNLSIINCAFPPITFIYSLKIQHKMIKITRINQNSYQVEESKVSFLALKN